MDTKLTKSNYEVFTFASNSEALSFTETCLTAGITDIEFFTVVGRSFVKVLTSQTVRMTRFMPISQPVYTVSEKS